MATVTVVNRSNRSLTIINKTRTLEIITGTVRVQYAPLPSLDFSNPSNSMFIPLIF